MYSCTFSGASSCVYINNAFITDYDAISSIILRLRLVICVSQIIHKVLRCLQHIEIRRSSKPAYLTKTKYQRRGSSSYRGKMTSLLDLPFELQSQILGYAFEEALENDLASQNVQPYSKVSKHDDTIHGTPTTALSPMHQTTNTHILFANMLSLTISPSTFNTLSPNQLTYCLHNIRKQIALDSIVTKAMMRDIVLSQPWARITGDTYCALWRRKERAELINEVIRSALATLVAAFEAVPNVSH
jgi:hypothetical protein